MDNKQLLKINEWIKMAKEKISELENDNSNLREQINNKNIENENLKIRLEEIEREKEDLKNYTRGIEDMVKELEDKNSILIKEKESQQEEINRLKVIEENYNKLLSEDEIIKDTINNIMNVLKDDNLFDNVEENTNSINELEREFEENQ